MKKEQSDTHHKPQPFDHNHLLVIYSFMFVPLLLAISPRNTNRAFEETFFTHAVWGENGRRQGEARLQT